MFAVLRPGAGKISRRFLLPFAFLVLLCGGSLTPRPAFACMVMCADATAAQVADTSSTLAQWGKEFLEWAKQFELLMTIINVVSGILGVVNDIRDVMSDQLGILIAVTHIENFLQYFADLKMHEETKKNNIENMINGKSAGFFMDNYRRPDIRAACYAYVANQGRGANYFFKQTVANAILQMLETRYIGRKADGSGPQTAAFMFGLLCPPASIEEFANFPRLFPKEMNPPANCLDSEGKYAGLLSARIVSGSYVLQLPEFQTVTVDKQKFQIPDPKEEEEKYFLAANAWLVLAAGERATPPYGSAMKSVDGVNKIATFFSFSARESAFLQPCANLLAYLTRTNCKGKDAGKYKAKCVRDKWLCDAAENAKFKDAEGKTDVDIKKLSGVDCDKGLSDHQADYLRAYMCLSPQGMTALAGANAKEKDIQRAAMSCAGAWESFEQRMTEMQNACSRGLDAVGRHRLREMQSR